MKRSLLTVIALVGLLGVALPTPAFADDEERSGQARLEWDPWERFNRKLFWFNESADQYVIEPVARGWDWTLPDAVQRSIERFFLNLRLPLVAINDVLQDKPKDATIDVARFAVNTTVGLVGFLDVATGWGLERHDEDFGQTLAVWGVGAGPYFVIPLLGPSNVRDGLASVVDRPTAALGFFTDFFWGLGATTLETLNRRSLYLDDIEEARAASLDFYSAARNAYAQRRWRLIHDLTDAEPVGEEDLYFLDDEEDLYFLDDEEADDDGGGDAQ